MRSKLRPVKDSGLLRRRHNLRSHAPPKTRRRLPGTNSRKKDQQTLLLKLLESVNRARSLGEIYKAAVDAVCCGLEADRASILTCDEKMVMRFRFVKGLSQQYCQAVEGHSPWKPGDRDPQVVTIADIETAKIDPHLRPVVLKEGIRAVAFIPLTFEGELLGKFMVYYDSPHRFTPAELRLAT